MSITAMKQALEALDAPSSPMLRIIQEEAITSLRQAIEQAEKQGPKPIDHLLAENARLWGLIYDLHKKIAPDTTQAGDGDCTDGKRLCAELKAKEQKEPVAWVTDLEFDSETELIPARRKGQLGTDGMGIPLYAQPQREWVGLTQQDIDIAFDDTQEGGGFNEFARAIEQSLKEKNHG